MHSFPNLEPVCFLSLVLSVASWPAHRFLRGRSGALVIPSLEEFSTICCDPHSQRLWDSQQSRSRCFSRTVAFSMIQRILAIRSLVTLPFLNPAWTSGSSWFTYCWSLAWRILSFIKICKFKLSLHKYISHWCLLIESWWLTVPINMFILTVK